jgi:hypothetical protein
MVEEDVKLLFLAHLRERARGPDLPPSMAPEDDGRDKAARANFSSSSSSSSSSTSSSREATASPRPPDALLLVLLVDDDEAAADARLVLAAFLASLMDDKEGGALTPASAARLRSLSRFLAADVVFAITE